MLRRLLLATTAFLSLTGAASAVPNVVVIVTDDQRWDAVGAAQAGGGRFPFLRTPNMDRLAREGTRFSNAFTVSSLCSPARASMLTSQYPHRHGVKNNKAPFPVGATTYATLMKNAGYRTGYFGKWHMGVQRVRPGFDFTATYDGQGVYNGQTFRVNGVDHREPGWVDDTTARYAANFIRGARPFLAVVGFKSSHGPNIPPPEHANDFPTARARAVASATSYMPYDPSPEPAFLPDEQVRDYFRTLAGADDALGDILAAVDTVPGETIVVFTSDNGYLLGEHGVPGRPLYQPVLDTDGNKRNATEELIRIPLIIRGGGARAGAVMTGPVLNIDLAPTLLAAAGLPVPSSMQGKSLLTAMRTGAGVRSGFVYEYFREGIYNVPDILALRQAGYKLVRYPGHPEWLQLFDYLNDPLEMANLVASQPDRVRTMQTELDRQLRTLGYR